MDKHWIAETREVWGREANRALERAGRSEDRVDHRSLAAQFTDESLSGAATWSEQQNAEPGAVRPSWSAEAAGRLNRASASCREVEQEQPRAWCGSAARSTPASGRRSRRSPGSGGG